MKQKISILMDGELSEDEAEMLLGKIQHNPDARKDWMNYHLIGDVLRQPEFVHNDISSAIFSRLKDEPTVLSPRTRMGNRAGYFAMSAVASIMAIAFLAWLSVQIDIVPVHRLAMQDSGDTRNANLPANEAVNDYLLAHQEYSPSSDMRGAASYIRTVSYQNSAAGQ